jgi:hypothetical protein
MNVYGGVDMYLHALTLALDIGELAASRTHCFTSGERAPNTR